MRKGWYCKKRSHPSIFSTHLVTQTFSKDCCLVPIWDLFSIIFLSRPSHLAECLTHRVNALIISTQFLIGGKVQESNIAKLNEWPAQCVYKAFGCFSLIRACTPVFSPLIVLAPSYPWPRKPSSDKPNSSKVWMIALAISTARTRSNFVNDKKSSLISPRLSTKRIHIGKYSVLWH